MSLRYRVLLLALLLSGFAVSAAEKCKQEQCHNTVVFITEHSMPGTYLNEQGVPAGVMVELVQELSRRMQQQGAYFLMPWARAMQRAQQTPRSVLFETVRNPEREALFKWVGPVKFFDMQLYGPAELAGLSISAAELSQRYVACGYRGASYQQALESMGFNEGQNLVLMSRAGDCVQMLRLGRSELTPLNVLRHGPRYTEAGLNLVPLQPISEVSLYLAFSLDFSDEEIALWQQQLDLMFNDGTVRKLYQGTFSDELIQRLERAAQRRIAIQQTGAERAPSIEAAPGQEP